MHALSLLRRCGQGALVQGTYSSSQRFTKEPGSECVLNAPLDVCEAFARKNTHVQQTSEKILKVRRIIIIVAGDITALKDFPALLAAFLPNTQNKLIKSSVRHGSHSAFILPPFTSVTSGTRIMTHVLGL